MCSIDRHERYRRFKKIHDCFNGAEVVAHILAFLHQQDDPKYQKAGRENATILASKLMSQRLFAPANGLDPFADTDKFLFVLTDAGLAKRTATQAEKAKTPSHPVSEHAEARQHADAEPPVSSTHTPPATPERPVVVTMRSRVKTLDPNPASGGTAANRRSLYLAPLSRLLRRGDKVPEESSTDPAPEAAADQRPDFPRSSSLPSTPVKDPPPSIKRVPTINEAPQSGITRSSTLSPRRRLSTMFDAKSSGTDGASVAGPFIVLVVYLLQLTMALSCAATIAEAPDAVHERYLYKLVLLSKALKLTSASRRSIAEFVPAMYKPNGDEVKFSQSYHSTHHTGFTLSCAGFLYGRALTVFKDGVPPWLPQITAHIEKCNMATAAMDTTHHLSADSMSPVSAPPLIVSVPGHSHISFPTVEECAAAIRRFLMRLPRPVLPQFVLTRGV